MPGPVRNRQRGERPNARAGETGQDVNDIGCGDETPDASGARVVSDGPGAMTDEERRIEKSVDRIAFFSDAIFAIAITLLTLQLSIPKGLSVQQLNQELVDNGPAYFSFALSFYVIGSFWIGHHRLFGWVRRYDNALLRLNLLFMAAVAFLPFPTEVVGRYGGVTSADVLYAASMVVTGALLMLLWQVAGRRRLLDASIPAQSIAAGTYRQLATVLPFLVSIPVAFVNAEAALYVWIAVAFLKPAGNLLFRRRRHDSPDE